MHKYYHLAAVALLAMCMTACRAGDPAADELAHHHHDHGHEHAEHHHDHGDDHDHDEADEHAPGEIVLAPAMAARLGVKADTIQPTLMASALHVSGTIQASDASRATAVAPVAGIVRLAPGISVGATVAPGTTIATIDASATAAGNQSAAAKAALDAAKREVDRLEPLYRDRLVSASTYNAALAAYEQAKAAYSPSAAQGRVTAPARGVITAITAATGDFADTGAPIAVITSGGNLTLRADVPARHAAAATAATDARIVTSGGRSVTVSELGGHRSADASAAAMGGYVPVFFTFPTDGTVLAGEAAEVYLLGAPRQVLAVPRTALTEQQGRLFVYRQIDEDCYEKVPVSIGTTDGRLTEIISGIVPGDVIVTEGAVAVRLAESSGNVPEGHTHNH